MGIILHQPFGRYEDRIIMYRDSFKCEICNDYVIYIGLDKHHSTLCQTCQDELARGRGMSSKFRKMYFKHLEQEKKN